MPSVEDRGGIAPGGDDPWKGDPAAIVERVARIVRECTGIERASPEMRRGPDLGLDPADLRECGRAAGKEFRIESDGDGEGERVETLGQLVLYLKDRTE
jgi:hypothetical protein